MHQPLFSRQFLISILGLVHYLFLIHTVDVDVSMDFNENGGKLFFLCEYPQLIHSQVLSRSNSQYLPIGFFNVFFFIFEHLGNLFFAVLFFQIRTLFNPNFLLRLYPILEFAVFIKLILTLFLLFTLFLIFLLFLTL